MNTKKEILVAGCGIAGFTAALAAARQEKPVRLIYRGPGATALSSGAMSLSHSFSCSKGSGKENLAQAVEDIPAMRPSHPYAVIGKKGRSRIREALGFVCDQLGEAGLKFLPPRMNDSGYTVIGITGEFRNVVSAQLNQAIDLPDPERTCFALLKPGGMAEPDFSLSSEAFRLRKINIEGPFELDWPQGRSGFLPSDIGKLLDDPKEARHFAEIVRNLIIGRGVTHILMPAIAGMDNCTEVRRIIMEKTGAEPVEFLGSGNSLPGYRLHRAMLRALDKAGVIVVRDDKIPEHEGPFVLATGRFTGGGISRRGMIRESLFGLPVFDGEKSLKDEPVQDLTEQPFLADHSIFRAGVKTDEKLRPLDERGIPLRENLFAAGSVIGAYDPHADCCGMGTAIITGYLAGINASEWG